MTRLNTNRLIAIALVALGVAVATLGLEYGIWVLLIGCVAVANNFE